MSTGLKSNHAFKAFRRDTRGQVAVILGVCAIPIVIAASIGLDMASSSSMKSEIQAAADSAVLAAARRLAVGADESDKEALAIGTFYANLSPALQQLIVGSPEVDIDFPSHTIKLIASVTTDTLLSSLATDQIVLGIEAAATISEGNPICMMALNPTAPGAISIQGTADVLAEGCSIQVNSEDEQALYQNGNGTASATSYCVAGGVEGDNYTPTPRENCAAEKDPLEDEFASDWAQENIDSLACTYTDHPQINTTATTTTNLSPGVYCGGLSIKKGIVQLQTNGIYVFRDGPLDMQSQGRLLGTSVVVLFDGDDTTRLVTQAGASIVTSARSSGTFQGIAFAQHPSSVPASPNLIIGGGEVDINGIMYFPEQALKITGGGEIGTNAAQFAIMADTIAIEGNGELRIKIGQDYQSTGLPALPAADEVVYLVE
jgi:Putative Flp pilus-assembly TadE/G-like